MKAILRGGPPELDGKAVDVKRGQTSLNIPVLVGYWEYKGMTTGAAFGRVVYQRTPEREHGRLVFRESP